MKSYYLLLALLLLGCTKNSKKTALEKPVAITKTDTTAIKQNDFHKLKKLFVTGDFDGDKKTDTVYQGNYSKLQNKEIDFAPSPFKVDWEEVVKWFYDQDSDITLTINKAKSDVLHLGTGQGLYCMINVGDTNKDGKDEVAFVVDECDYSNTNTCKIYGLCNGQWQLLLEFGIHEGAFDWPDGIQPKFTEIKEYLEKHNNVWMYKDYNQMEYDSPEEVGQMKVLKAANCR